MSFINQQFSHLEQLHLVYLDNAATTQKPKMVIEAINDYYTNFCSNIHRSSSHIANQATIVYEQARSTIKNFLNAKYDEEIIFTAGITDSFNSIASGFAKQFDTVIISTLEHHSNIVPWHLQGKTLNKGLQVVQANEYLYFDMAHFEQLLKKYAPCFVSILHTSNAFGVVHPIKEITQLAKQYDCIVMVDGAQSTPHFAVDVQDLGVDLYAISGHKMYGPTGIGALYINSNLFNDIKPYQGGGGSIQQVDFDKTIYAKPPLCYEAGTPKIAQAIGFKAAIDFIKTVNYQQIEQIEKELFNYLIDKLNGIKNLECYTNYANGSNHIGSCSFNIIGFCASDLGILLDKQNIAIRYGHHCVQPALKMLNIDGTIRVSLAIYNTKADIDHFITALHKAISML